ncbi:MAG TPA: nuclear transport factor 2 family protein [Solirubrobacterales bacterium]|nr:nuclear transport factor 2 family protein [Solirubrobacterales bacterium]
MCRSPASRGTCGRFDFEAATEWLHPAVVWHRLADVERPTPGIDAVKEFMRPQVFTAQRTEVPSIEVIGECILVEDTFHGEGAASGIRLDQRGFHLWRMRDGKPIE